jgi:hypothetical protein
VTAVQVTVSAASSPRWLASALRSGSFFRSATCRAISILRLMESSLRKTGHQVGIPGSPSLSRRPRPERLRQQNPSSENISIDQAAACQLLEKRSEVDASLERIEPRERGRMSMLFDKLNLSRAASVAAIPASGPSRCVARVNGCSLQWLGQELDQCNHSRRRSCATHPRTPGRLAERRHRWSFA